MADLLADIVHAQVAATVVILLVLAMRRPVRGRVGARTAYGLWLLPVFGAAAALAPSRQNLVLASSTPATPAMPLDAMPDVPGLGASLLGVVSPQALLGVWIGGVAASLAWVILCQARCRAWARAGAIGPAVIGFWRPVIALPIDFEERYTEAQRALILEHEQTHLRRQDSRVIGLALTLRALAWFNPLAYIALRRLRIDQELACDASILARFPNMRRVYAETLAKSQLANRPLLLGCYWPSETEHPLLERLAMLNSAHVGRRRAGAYGLAALCASTSVAAWAAMPAETVYQAIEPAPARSKAANLPPVDICLTNACSRPLKSPDTPKTVSEAISAGKANVVRDLGGAPAEALAAVDTRVKARLAETALTDPDLVAYARRFWGFADTSDGSTLTYVPERSDGPDGLGLLVVGGIERRSPDGQVDVMQLLDNGAGRLTSR